MDLRRFRAVGSNQPSPRRRQSIDGFMAPSRSLPRTPLQVPKVQPLQPKTNHPAPALRRRPEFKPPQPQPVANTQPRPLAIPDNQLRARPVTKQVSHQIQPRYQTAPSQPLGYRRPITTPSRPQPVRKNLQKRYIVVPAVIVVGCFMISVFNRSEPTQTAARQTNSQTSQPAAAVTPEVETPTYPTSEQEEAFKASVNQLMSENSSIRSTVIATNLKTGKSVILGSDQPYIAASTGKLLTAATVYQQLEQGRMTLATKLSNGQTVKYNLQTMIVDSNNASWEVLNSYVTRAKLTARAKEIGMTNYVNRSNSLSAADTNLLVRKLYDGNLINSEHRTQLLEWMKQANYRGYMVAAVPDDYTIYHKVGIYEDVLHDVGIITKGDEALELTIYTDGNGAAPDPARTAYIKSVTTAALKAFFAPSETGTSTTQPAI